MALTLTITDEFERIVIQGQLDNYAEIYFSKIGTENEYSYFKMVKPKLNWIVKDIRKYAQEWAEQQDLEMFSKEFRKIFEKEFIKSGDFEAQTYFKGDNFPVIINELYSCLVDIKQKESKKITKFLGKDGGFIFFYMRWEILLAMVRILVNKSNPVQTIWEYSESMSDRSASNSILGWLFRR